MYHNSSMKKVRAESWWQRIKFCKLLVDWLLCNLDALHLRGVEYIVWTVEKDKRNSIKLSLECNCVYVPTMFGMNIEVDHSYICHNG